MLQGIQHLDTRRAMKKHQIGKFFYEFEFVFEFESSFEIESGGNP